MRLAKRSIALVPQTAVVSSLAFGMISGSPSSNVAATGQFTIPLMKKMGISPEEAGAIEAVASAGGQIMPPVMGVAAFLMVAFIGKSYLFIITRAFPIAFIFYMTLAFSVDLVQKRSVKRGLAGGRVAVESRASAPQPEVVEISREQMLGLGASVVISIGVLIGLLSAGFAVPFGARFMVLTFLALNFIRILITNRKQGLIAGLKEFGLGMVRGLAEGGRTISRLFMMIIPITIIISGMVNTALNIKLANFILYLGSESMIYVVLATAILCILFGCAVSTTGTYIIVSVILAPALVTLGMNIFVAHMFIFYYAILSNLSPPVAVASTVAASVANANFLRLCRHAMAMGLPLYIFPMVFVFYPNILLFDAMTPVILLLMAVAFFGFAYAIYGKKRMIRMLFAPLGMVILFHGLIGLWAGIAAAVAIVALSQVDRIRRLIPMGSLRK